MHFSFSLGLLLAGQAVSLVHEKRQFGGLFGIAQGAKVKDITDVKPRIRPDAKRQLIRYGPFTIPAVSNNTKAPSNGFDVLTKAMDPQGHLISMMPTDGICKDCTILAGKADVTLEDGTRADIKDGLYLHHILAFDTTKRAPDFVSLCPKSKSGKSSILDRLMPAMKLPPLFLGGAVNEYWVWYTTPDGKEDSGYYIGKNGNKFWIQSEVVTYKKAAQQVYLTLDLEYLPGKVGRDSLFTLLLVTGCAGVGYKSSEPQNNLTSGEFPIQSDGKLINVRGHLHDGGSAMELFLNNKMICHSDAIYGGKGGTLRLDNGKKWETISEMTDCNEVIKVKKGDLLKLKSIYDLKKHPLRETHGGHSAEEMGIFTFSFVPDKDRA